MDCTVLPYDGIKGLCAYCGRKLTGRRRKWCSDECRSWHDFFKGYIYRDVALSLQWDFLGGKLRCEVCGLTKQLRKPWQQWSKMFMAFGMGIAGHFEVDHIIAWCRGGKNRLSNLQVLCKRCHARKTGRDVRGKGRKGREGKMRRIKALF